MNPTLVAPLEPPYEAETKAMLEKWMPPGAPFEPLALFRSMARNPDLMVAMRSLGSYFLGSRSCLPIRQREMVILRTCARVGCEYEWGVHVTAFAEHAGLSKVDIRELTSGAAESPHWTATERTILHACDQIVATANLDTSTRKRLQHEFDDATILALITLTGWYRLIASVANTVCAEGESWSARLADYS